MKLTSRTVEIPLYGGQLVIVKCENWEPLKEVYKDALKKYSTQPNEKHDGYAFEAITENGTDQYIVAFKGTPEGSVIAHECVHLVNNLYANRAIELNLYDDEHQAYLLEWFFDQIDNFYKPVKEIIGIKLPKNRFTLRAGEMNWHLDAFQSPRGLRNGSERPDTLVIDFCQVFNANELGRFICYLETLKQSMQ